MANLLERPDIDDDGVPVPPDPEDLHRWEHSRMRRRVLYSRHERDVLNRVRAGFGKTRTEAFKVVDLSCNVAQASYTVQAVLYDRRPLVAGDEGVVGDDGIATKAGLWELMRTVQRDTLGLRVMFLRPEVVRGKMTYRPVFPDHVTVERDADDPTVPRMWAEARQFENATTHRFEWAWEVFDLRDSPTWGLFQFRSTDNGGKERIDVTDRYLLDAEGTPGTSLVGEAYPWRWTQDGPNRSAGDPYIPVGFYRAALTADFWDAWTQREVYEGTLTCSSYYTMLGHLLRTSSWPQRYGVDVVLEGGKILDEDSDGDGRRAVTLDPATVAMFKRHPDAEGQPMLGQFSASSDPKAFLETVQAYERRVASMAGLNPADISRVSGDPRSGYALALTRDGQRDAAARHAPIFRFSDLDLLAKTAAVANNNNLTDSPLDEGGYQIEYQAIEKSPDEAQAEAAYLNEEVANGMMDRVEAYQRRHPGVTREEAEERLRQIAETNRRFPPA